MGKVRYIPGVGGQQALDRYYHQQGSGLQYFSGPGHQRGHGLGGLFGRLFRAAVPLLKNTVAPMMKKAGKAVAKEALTTGVGLATDLLDGEPFGDSVRGRLNTAANRMTTRGVNALEKMVSTPGPTRRRRAVRRRGGLGKRGRKSIKGSDLYS